MPRNSAAQVTLAGYAHVTQVVSPGEYSIRGGLIDLFPMGSQLPYRLDLFDDEIESIKTFDVDTQRTVYPVPEVRLLPAREFPMDDKGAHALPPGLPRGLRGRPGQIGHIQGRDQRHRQRRHRVLPAAVLRCDRHGLRLPAGGRRVRHTRRCAAAIAAFWRETRSRYNLLQGDKARPLLPPDQLFLRDEAFFTAAKSYGRVVFSVKSETPAASALPDIAVDRRAEDPLGKLKNHLAGFPGRVLLLAESAGRRETLATMLAEHGLKPAASADFAGFAAADARLALGVGPLHGGFALPGLAFITRNRALRRLAAPHPARSGAQGQLRQLVEGPHRTQDRRSGGA